MRPAARSAPLVAGLLLGSLAGCERPSVAEPEAPRLRPRPALAPPTTSEASLTGVPSVPISPWLTVPAPAAPAPLAMRRPAPAEPVPSAEARRLREALNGTWRYVRNATNDEGGMEESECVLIVTPAGAHETCTTTTHLGPTQAPWPCALGRRPWIRVTGSPYAIAFEDGELVFRPGEARLLRDNGCTPQPAGSHTEMRTRWDGVTDEMVMTEMPSSGTPARYVRMH